MERNLKIVEALANGVNPLTGELLPSDSFHNDPEVIRALFAVINQIKSNPVKKTIHDKKIANARNDKPMNAGLPWTEGQRSSLIAQFNSGKTVAVMAKIQGRSNYAIVLELKRQGLIDK